jgi:hypothetical protein
MTGSSWRLLAIASLIVVLLTFAAPVLLRGQDAAVSRSPAIEPTAMAPSRSSTTAPVWIPPPSVPRTYPAPPGTIVFQQVAFQQLVRAAGIIFLGRVTFIGHAAASSGENPASTTVTFQVEYAMRGATPGQSLTIHEWAGLWAGGERYSMGERVLLFLYSPGKLGLSSPVAGTMGRFAVDSQGRVVMSPQHVAIFAADPVLGGKAIVPYADFAAAVRRSSGEEWGR